jgi:alanine dehydrogenase
MIKVAIITETKNPPDRRVAITPKVANAIKNAYKNVEIMVQSSDLRSFTDLEYKEKNIEIVESISNADILIGVKEVKLSELLADKTYLFFSHVGKKQPYNRELLQTVLKKNITLIDYEYLLNAKNERVVAFGRWAGIVGAYNSLLAYGLKFKLFNLPPAIQLKDLEQLKEVVKSISIKSAKFLITGEGRVASGAIEILDLLNFKKVSAQEFLTKSFNEPVLCQIGPKDYVKRKDGNAFDLKHFFENPQLYESTFLPFTKLADVYISCHYWDNRSPRFITQADLRMSDFNIKIIADVSCDIKQPIASTIRPSIITEPFYDYNPFTFDEEKAFTNIKNVTVMAVDNLPGSLPRDSSEEFANALFEQVFPSLFGSQDSQMIARATIAKNGKLTPHFEYLQNYADGKE